ncbi:GNAT family N-acetyltransferase [Halorussus salilacus]|uniref:GNAT family N-acetyltransferase n=1 Tax=Halorussus salilacus TaxID=2953750 RepID=UPI00209E1A6D|nr:GNAT family N-acetyltransferase [Halorussus salilacus]USZ68174.1 GNAT family N-acetyltransferase [Halorussus salilacus]
MSAEADEADSSGDGTEHVPAGSEPAEPFPTPPRRFGDREDRTLRLGVSHDSAALSAMYDDFGVADRAQGIPPADPDRRRRWLDRIAQGIEVVAWHGDDAVGHGVLLAGGPGHELALFVHPEYRGAGVGTALARTLLGRGREAGVERVWLSVRRGNRAAVRLYRRVGFAPTGDAAGELEMTRRLG